MTAPEEIKVVEGDKVTTHRENIIKLILCIIFLIGLMIAEVLLWGFITIWTFIFFLVTFFSVFIFIKCCQFQETKKLAYLGLTFMLVFSLVLGHGIGQVLLTNNIYTNGQLSYSNYPIYVAVRVEEPLSVDYATFTTLIALESINQTFGYRMILDEVTTFENDNKEFYNDSRSEPGYERAKLRLNAKMNNQVDIRINFFKGKGREIETWAGTTSAAGTSGWGQTINLYFEEPASIYFTNIDDTLYGIKTILHEFGHSFGLPHNVRSPIMFTSEKKDNPCNASRPEWNITVNETSFSPGEQFDQNYSAEAIFQEYIVSNISYPILFNNTYTVPINPHLVYYDYILDNWPSNTISYVHMLKHYNGGSTVNFTIQQYSFNLSDYSCGWLSKELERC